MYSFLFTFIYFLISIFNDYHVFIRMLMLGRILIMSLYTHWLIYMIYNVLFIYYYMIYNLSQMTLFWCRLLPRTLSPKGIYKSVQIRDETGGSITQCNPSIFYSVG